MTHVVSDDGWGKMRWARLERLAGSWSMQTIDTTDMTKLKVGDAVLDWCRRALSHEAPTLRVTSTAPQAASALVAQHLLSRRERS